MASPRSNCNRKLSHAHNVMSDFFFVELSWLALLSLYYILWGATRWQCHRDTVTVSPNQIIIILNLCNCREVFNFDDIKSRDMVRPRQVNLSVTLGKPIIPLLMERIPWPPPGSMGPIFGEYIFVRFFQREEEKLGPEDDRYWATDKFTELLMQLRYTIAPDASLITTGISQPNLAFAIQRMDETFQVRNWLTFDLPWPQYFCPNSPQKSFLNVEQTQKQICLNGFGVSVKIYKGVEMTPPPWFMTPGF